MTSFRLGVILLAHHEPDQLAVLMSVLKHPQVDVYLHIDRRSQVSPFRDALSRVSTGSVRWLPRRRSRWGGIEVVDSMLDGLAQGLDDGCGYFMLLSGNDFPLRGVAEIVEFAGSAPRESYLEDWPLPTDRWDYGGRERTEFYSYTVLGRRETCIPVGEDLLSMNARGRLLNSALRIRTAFKPPRRFPGYVEAHAGSEWWNLSQGTARHILQFLERHPDYRRYHDHTLVPDEIFIQSIVRGSQLPAGESVTDDDLRFVLWPDNGSHPRMLTIQDIPALNASTDLFARKVSRVHDPALFQHLLERITP